MKILFITKYAQLLGANRSMLHLIDELSQMGYHCIVILKEQGEIESELSEKKIKYYQIPFQSWIRNNTNHHGFKKNLKFYLLNFYFHIRLTWHNSRLVKQLLKVEDIKNIDLVYTNNTMLDVGCKISELLKVPHIWHVRESLKLFYNCEPFLGWRYFKYKLNKSDKVRAISHYQELCFIIKFFILFKIDISILGRSYC